MQIIQSVAPDMSAALTNDNKLVIMVETDDGEHLAEVTDIDHLVRTLRNLELIQMERKQWGRFPGTVTTAEAELAEDDRLRNERSEGAERERIATVALHNSLADRLDKLGLTGYHVQSYESPGSRMKIKVTDLEALVEMAEKLALYREYPS